MDSQPTLHARLVSAFIAFGTLPVVAFGVLVAAVDHAARQRHGAETLQVASQAASNATALLLEGRLAAMRQLADRLGASPSSDDVQRALAETRAAVAGFVTLQAADARGMLVGAVPPVRDDGRAFDRAGVDIDDRAYFRIPRATGAGYVSGVVEDRHSGQDRLVAVSAPIRGPDGRFAGVVQGAIRLADLGNLLASAAQPDVAILVLDADRRVVYASPGLPFAVAQPLSDLAWLASTPRNAAHFVPLRLPDAPLGGALVSEHGTPQGWRVLTMLPRWNLVRRGLLDLALLLLFAGAVALLAAQAGRMHGRRVVKPLQELGARLDHLSMADVPQPTAIRARDRELARLEEAFARMAQRFGSACGRLQDDLATESILREELAQSIAGRRAIDAELSIAAGIQQSMVPGREALLQVSPRLDIAGLLEPARAVGGDFFNVIRIDDRHACFYIGDVSDKGVAAALFMARIATLLEVVARQGESPGHVLSVVAAEAARHNPSEMFATVLCGVLDVDVGTLSLASAGHDPPVVLHVDGRIERLSMDTGPALGFESEVEYAEWHLRLKPGDALLSWTDGLTEAPDAAGRPLGDDGVDAVLDGGAASAEALLGRLAMAVSAHTGGAAPHDDLTLLVLRREPVAVPAPVERPPVLLEMPNRIAVLPVLGAALDDALADEGVAEAVRKDVALLMEEVLSNTVRHGYPDGRRDTIRVEARREGDRLHLLFDDGGTAWNPLEHDLPDLDADLDDREIGGLGVLLVRELSESVQYERSDGRNRLHLVVRLAAQEEVEA